MPSTGVDSSGASRHTRRRTNEHDSISPGESDLHYHRRHHVRASIEQTFKSLVAQIGRLNETPDGTPLPMVLETHPGGRWYRDLGGDNGHLWGFVQSIKRPTLLEIWGPLFMSTARPRT